MRLSGAGWIFVSTLMIAACGSRGAGTSPGGASGGRAAGRGGAAGAAGLAGAAGAGMTAGTGGGGGGSGAHGSGAVAGSMGGGPAAGGGQGLAGRGAGMAGAGGRGGAGGQGGSPPLSTGSFPFPGRWWAHMTGPLSGGGQGGAGGQGGRGGQGGAAPVQTGPFVIHWSADDPADRAIWTLSNRYAFDASSAPEGGTTLTSKAPEIRTCWTLYATADPDTLQVQPCGQPPSTGAPPLGLFHRGARLLHEIPILPSSNGSQSIVSASVDAFGPQGRSFTFRIGSELYLWRDDTREKVDVGPGAGVVFSPNGQRFIYLEPSADQSSAMKGYDIATKTGTVIGRSKYSGSPLPGLVTAMFAPDSRHAVVYTNVPYLSGATSDLVAFDFGSGMASTLATQMPRVPFEQAVVFLASGNHLLFSTGPSSGPSGSQGETFAYDFAAGTSQLLGNALELTAVPGGAFAAYRTGTGDVTVIDDATWTPRVIGSTRTGPTTIENAGLQPSPDGKWLTFVDAVRTFHVWNLAGGMDVMTFADQASCVADPAVAFQRPLAAVFTSDGRSILHPLKGLCDAFNGLEGLGRIELASMKETTGDVQALFFKTNVAISASGQIAYAQDSLGAPMLQTWQGGPPLALDYPPDTGNSSGAPTFVFSTDERYLFYTAHGNLLVRDAVMGVTTKLAAIGVVYTSPAKAVAVVWSSFNSNDGSLTAYPPSGGSTKLATFASAPLASPTTGALAFTNVDIGGDGLYLYTFSAQAPGQLIENGRALGISEHVLVFRDLDGLCMLPY